MNDTADIIVRLIAEDDQIQEAFRNSGEAGEAALKRLQEATEEPGQALSALDGLVVDLRDELGGLSNELGPFGRALQGAGIIGAAAAVGIGAFFAAARTAAAIGESSARAIAEIGAAADNVNLRPEIYQTYSAEVIRAGESTEDLDNVLGGLNDRLDAAAAGQGGFLQSLLQSNPELAQQLQIAETLEDRLRLLGAAYEAAGSETERNRILTAAFGSENSDVSRLILTAASDTETLTQTYKDLGLVLDDVFVRRAQNAAAQLDISNRRIEVSQRRLGSVFSEFAVNSKEDLADFFNVLANRFAPDIEQEIERIETRLAALQDADRLAFNIAVNSDFDNNEIETLKAQLSDLNSELERSAELTNNPGLNSFLSEQERLSESLAALRESAVTSSERQAAALENLNDIRTAGLITSDEEFNRLEASIRERFRDVSAIRAQAEETRRIEAERRRLDQQRQRGIEIISGLNDEESRAFGIAQKVSQFQRDLIENQSEYGLSTEQVMQAVSEYTAELDGTAAAQERLLQIYNQIIDPVERFKAETAELENLQALANIPAELFNEILEQRAGLLSKIEQAQSDAAEREEFGETLDDAQARIEQSLLSATEVIDARIEMERAITDALISEGRLEATEADRYLANIRDELEQTRDATFDLERAQEQLIGGLIRGGDAWDSLRNIAVQALEDILLQQLRLTNSTSGGGGGGGIFGSIGRALGGFFGGSNSNPAPATSASVSHSGQENVGQNSPAMRQVPIDIFKDAPRNHDGNPFVGADEQATILQNGERVISRTDNAALVAALRRPQVAIIGGGGVSVNVMNFGNDEVRTETREGADGNRELFIEIGKRLPRMVLDTISSPDGARVMQARFGLRPVFGS